MNASRYSDPVLIRQFLAGDQQSRDIVLRLVERRVRAYLARVTLDSNQAADWTQDTMVSVIQSIGMLKDPRRFWPWVFAIASNRAKSELLQRSRRRTTLMSALAGPVLSDMAGSDDEQDRVSREQLAGLARRALVKLPPRHRRVLSMRFYEEMSHSQIAAVLGCSETGVRAAFFRAKQAMKRELKQLGVEEDALVA